MFPVNLMPPGDALHSTVVRYWDRFMQVDNRLLMTNNVFQHWLLLYSWI